MRKTVCVWLLLILAMTATATAEIISLLPTPTSDEEGNAQNNYYTATYADNPTSGNTVTFTREGISIGLQPHSLNWNNNLSQLQQINMPQNVARNKNANSYEYTNAYGEGITLRYKNEWYGVKEEIIIQQFSDLSPIAQYVLDGGSPYLEANFVLTTNAQHIIIDETEWDLDSEVETQTKIVIRNDEGKDLYHLPRPIAIDANNNNVTGSYKLKKSANKLYVSMTIPYSFIETATYPLTIDPTFYVDYSPTPATYYENGDQSSTVYTSFGTVTDETVTLSDGNMNTYVVVSNTPAAQDNVVRASFSHQYTLGYRYFMRIYKNSAGLTNLLVYPHSNINTTNLGLGGSLAVNGIGYYNLEVTNQMNWMKNNTNLTGSIFRISSSSTSNNIQLSELMLRQEQNDTVSPVITTCQVDNNNATCNENITYSCIVTDNIGVDYVTFTITDGGVDTYHLPSKVNNLYTKTIVNTGFATKSYNLTNVTAVDLFSNEATTQPNITATYTCIDNCTPNWVAQYEDTSPCRTNNTILRTKTYIDTNYCDKLTGLPADNNTIISQYCNYCDPDWQDVGTECYVNETRYVEYLDYNFCYAITGLVEDSPPLDDQTWVACSYYDNEFNCTISAEPYLKKKVEYNCELPIGDYECINRVTYGQTDTLQVNPQKTERVQGGLININGMEESRENFPTSNGLLNAYYTDKNLVAETPFIITTICSDGNNTLTHQQLITPKIKDLDRTPVQMIWLKENAKYIVIIFLILLILSVIIGSLLYNAQGKWK